MTAVRMILLLAIFGTAGSTPAAAQSHATEFVRLRITTMAPSRIPQRFEEFRPTQSVDLRLMNFKEAPKAGRGSNTLLGAVIGAVVGVGICTAISNAVKNDRGAGFTTCDAKANIGFAAGGAVIGGLIGSRRR